MWQYYRIEHENISLGGAPLLNNKYWSNALREHGWPSITLMEYYFDINKKDDFDYYVDDFAPKLLPRVARLGLGNVSKFSH